MGARPGRVIYDEPTSFKADLVEPTFAAIRDRAGFATMRDEVSAQIYAAHE
ncbi:hypothetical protein NBRGN_027_01610 [Nocardia brasiliensis NBRC 14402]|nr:hypothetical protein NBRGN_027_01610 [Nocardia brasiliensis NBRC 14402]